MSRYGETPIGMLRWLECMNASSSEDVPGFGLCRASAGDDAGVLTVAKPDEDGQHVYVNGPVAIAMNAGGAVTGDDPIYALYEESDGTPAHDEEWGAGADSYKLRKGNAGFKVIGGTIAGETGHKRVLVRRFL